MHKLEVHDYHIKHCTANEGMFNTDRQSKQNRKRNHNGNSETIKDIKREYVNTMSQCKTKKMVRKHVTVKDRLKINSEERKFRVGQSIIFWRSDQTFK